MEITIINRTENCETKRFDNLNIASRYISKCGRNATGICFTFTQRLNQSMSTVTVYDTKVAKYMITSGRYDLVWVKNTADVFVPAR